MLGRVANIALILVLIAPVVFAQDPPEPPEDPAGEIIEIIEVFDVEAPNPFVTLPVNGQATTQVIFKDLSRDSGTGATGGAAQASTGQTHRTRVSIEPETVKPGWLVTSNAISFTTTGGDERPVDIIFQVDPLAEDAYYKVEVVFTTTDQFAQHEQTTSITLQGYTPGLDSFNAQAAPLTGPLEPREIRDVPITISNSVALVPRAFDIVVTDNPCGFDVATTTNNVVAAGASDEFPITLLTPGDKFWYPYESCLLTIEIYPSDNPSKVRTVTIPAQINGFYVDKAWYFRAPFIIAGIIIVAFIVKRRKERVEEEILGKPQKPWTIPSESLYLDELKKRDPQAAYVVRNYLMKEEYASALLWYKNYKKATKGTRAKERLIVRAEHKFEAWQDTWAKKAMKPEMEADAYEDKLQRRLDKQASREHKKALKKWGKQVKKAEAEHAKVIAKEEARWQRAAKKAEKKGKAVPDKPELGEAKLPPKPERQEIPLVSHSWQEKADRFREKMEAKEEKIRAQFEAKRGRQLRKLKRRVQKLMRKLDDDEFVDEHPLLVEAMAA